MAGTTAGRFGFDDDARGTNASLVEASGTDGAIPIFYQVGINRWVECAPDGSVKFDFDERQRDEWSIYLHDSDRAVDLQLDLHRKMVVYSDRNQSFDLYPISSALARASGLTLRGVTLRTFAGRERGAIGQTGTSTWCEFGEDGDVRFRFDEVQRDDWSVYLTDPTRGVQLQLDVHRNKVVYTHGGTASDLYDIAKPLVSGPHNLTPAPSGRTINRADFSAGAFVQTGPLDWVETGPDGDVRFHFIETARDRRAVHLSDVARRAQIQIHVDDKVVTYSDVNTERFELYNITNVASKVNGRTANRVTYADNDANLLGELRQTGTKTWIELGGDLQTKYRFVETHRDDWSVYLHDPSRGVYLQLDLHTRSVGYRDNNQAFELYRIEGAGANHADLEPLNPLTVKGHNIRTVHFGGMDGAPLGSLRQVGSTDWHELGADQETRFNFVETKRTNDALHLLDASRNVTLVVDLQTKRIDYTDSSQAFTLYTVRRVSAVMHGRLASEIEFAYGPDLSPGVFRRTDDGVWTEFGADNDARFHFDEVAIEDWLIRLHDRSRNVAIDLDLRLQRVMYGDGPNTTRTQYLILSERIESGIWLHSEKITSRSALTHDFNPDGQNLNEVAVYRTSVSFTPVTKSVEVWASKEVTVTIEGTQHTISPVQSANITIPELAKITISVPATDLDCPKLSLRTNLMMADHRHPIYPDVEAHKKIVALPDGALTADRHKLGVSPAFSDEDLGHVQRAMQNIARTKQYTYNRRPHGVHHDRVLHPANMEHPHFAVDFGGGAPRYQPLQPGEVAAHTAGAELVSADVGQDFLGIGHFFKKATKVVVHTVEAVADDVVKTGKAIVNDVVQTAENVGHDVIHTIDQVGEDLVHGDILSAGKDLWQGGEHLGSDLTSGAMHIVGDAVGGVKDVVGDVASGAGQLIVITLHAAEEAVQFVLTHTGAVGRLIQGLLDKIGAAIESVIGWLLDQLGWGDIVQTHDALISLFNSQMDWAATQPLELKKLSDTFFTDLSSKITNDLESAIKQFQPTKTAAQRSSPGPGHSGAVEKIEWFLGKLAHHASGAPTLVSPFNSPNPVSAHPTLMDDVVSTIEEKLGLDGDKLLGAIEGAVGNVGAIFSDPSHTPEYLMVALLEIVEAVAILAIDAVSVVIDLVLDAVAALINAIKDALNASWDIPFLGELYKTVTHGRDMTALGVISLLMAIPITLVAKANEDAAPFAHLGVAADLSSLSAKDKALGYSYGVAHVILAPISIVQDVRTGIEGATAGVNSMSSEWGGPASESGLRPGVGNIFSAIDWVLNFTCFFTSTPAPVEEPYIIPFTHGADDVFERPSYFGHVTFWYLFSGFWVNTMFTAGDIASSSRNEESANAWVGRVSTVFNCAFGIALMGLMGTIDVADRGKNRALATLDQGQANAAVTGQQLFDNLERLAHTQHDHVPYWSFDAAGGVVRGADSRHIRVECWEDQMRNYRKWGNEGGGIPRKGFANVMDSFPAIGQICAFPEMAEDTLGLSLIVTGVFDLLGHLGEGITYIDRTARNELV